jgi:hypothetical protein
MSRNHPTELYLQLQKGIPARHKEWLEWKKDRHPMKNKKIADKSSIIPKLSNILHSYHYS